MGRFFRNSRDGSSLRSTSTTTRSTTGCSWTASIAKRLTPARRD